MGENQSNDFVGHNVMPNRDKMISLILMLELGPYFHIVEHFSTLTSENWVDNANFFQFSTLAGGRGCQK